MTTGTELQRTLPTRLDSPTAKLVYLYLAAAGEATVSELQRSLGVSKLALFSVLDSLAEEGVVRRTEGGYACE